jgi:DNA-binding NtrC family response regulator
LHVHRACDALAKLETEAIEIAIVDLWMPIVNGLELLVKIRERWPRLPVVMMSGMWTAKAMQLACRAGSFYCVDKVSDGFIDEITALIEVWESGGDPIHSASSVEIPTLADVRNDYFLGLHAVCGSNVSATAEVMGVQRSSVQRNLKLARESRDNRRATERSVLREELERVALRKRGRRRSP